MLTRTTCGDGGALRHGSAPPSRDSMVSALHERLGARVRWLLERQLRDLDAAADVAQDVWMIAWLRAPLDRPAADVDRWILQVARHRLIDHVRRADRRRRREAHFAWEWASRDTIAWDGAHPDVDPPDLTSAVLAAAEQLPRRQRAVFTARLLHGRSTEETASALGIARGTVAATLHHACSSVRRRLAFTGIDRIDSNT